MTDLDVDLTTQALVQVVISRSTQAAEEHPEWIEEWRQIMAPALASLGSMDRLTILHGLWESTTMVPTEDGDSLAKAHWLLDHIDWLYRNFAPETAALYQGGNRG
jgi:hypothetical protein